MLIRSQDKEELSCFGETCVLRICPLDEAYAITFCVGREQRTIRIGEYKTMERCMEILDEIQNFYERSKVAEVYSMKPMFIYQMPEE